MKLRLKKPLPTGVVACISLAVTAAVIACATGCASPGPLKDVGYYSERRAVGCANGTTLVCRVGYSSRIRSLSQGRASFTMEPLKYAPAPPDVAEGFAY